MVPRALLVPIALLALGCTRAKECRRVIGIVNPALLEVADARASAPNASTGLRAAGARYEQAANDLAALQLHTKRLERAAKDYTALFNRTSKAVNTLAGATENDNRAAMINAKREVERALTQERLLVARVNSICQSP